MKVTTDTALDPNYKEFDKDVMKFADYMTELTKKLGRSPAHLTCIPAEDGTNVLCMVMRLPREKVEFVANHFIQVLQTFYDAHAEAVMVDKKGEA